MAISFQSLMVKAINGEAERRNISLREVVREIGVSWKCYHTLKEGYIYPTDATARKYKAWLQKIAKRA